MLVLTRKVGEGIAIGDDIRIIVMQVKGKQVRIGIKADPKMPVHREEIYTRIQEENELASHVDPQRMQTLPQILRTSKFLNESHRETASPLVYKKRE